MQQAKYRWSEDEFLNATYSDFEYGPLSGRNKASKWIIIGTLAGLVLLNMYQNNWQFEVWNLAIIAVGVGWFFLRGALMLKMFARAYKRSNLDGKEFTLKWNEKEFNLQLDKNPSQNLAWEDVKQITQVNEGFLIYPGPIWLPNKAVEGTSVPELAVFFKRKTPEFKNSTKN